MPGLFDRKPAPVVYLPVRMCLSVVHRDGEVQHQCVAAGIVVAAVETDTMDRETDFFLDLADGGIFGVFSDAVQAGEACAALRKAGVACYTAQTTAQLV